MSALSQRARETQPDVSGSSQFLLTVKQRTVATAMLMVAWAVTIGDVSAEERLGVRVDAASSAQSPTADSVLSDRQWRDLDKAVDRGLAYLATQQPADGSFEAHHLGQPAVTSLCVMAFLSRGHLPGEGPYSKQIERAVENVLSMQQEDGLISSIPRGNYYWGSPGVYHHAISGLMLGEVYGMTVSTQQESVRMAIERALARTREMQLEQKRWVDDRGAWRYLTPRKYIDSDLSVTSWQLMFYRSARNAGFDVPEESIDAAVEFVRRCYESGQGSFSYGLRGNERRLFSRAMAGAGILSLSLGGLHQSEMAQRAGDFVLKHPFTVFNHRGLNKQDRYFYGAYYCSQAMFQLGGDYWAAFYPEYLKTMLDNQRPNGSWDRDSHPQDGSLGSTYSTSLAVLSLTPPYQLLPIYQR